MLILLQQKSKLGIKEMINFLDYFDFNFEIEKEDKPKISIKLKKEYKKNVKSKNVLNSLTLDYFEYHIENKEIAMELYQFRKKMCNKFAAIEFMYTENIIDKSEFDFCQNWKNNVISKFKENHNIAMKSEKVRNNIRKSYNYEVNSRGFKILWEEQYEKIYYATQNNKIKNKRIESYKKWVNKNKETFLKICRNPSRISKISKSSRELWKNASLELKFKMSNNFKKSIKYKDFFMNKFEIKIAKYLDEKNLNWDYEKCIKTENSFVKPDFIVNNNIAIECFGDFWHANPIKYKSDDILFKNKTAAQQWEYDNNRIEKLKSIFDYVIIIWENETKNLNETMENKLLCLI